MASRFTPPSRPERPGTVQEIRSQLALEVLLHGYAVVGALIVFRALLKALKIDDHLWVGAAIYGVTDLVALPLTFIPGSGSILVGDLTLADATLVAFVVLFPLGLLVLGNRRKGR